MGCLGGIGCFDWQRWCDVIVPALKTGATTQRVAAGITELRHRRRHGLQFHGLGPVCMTFDPELSASPLGRGFWVDANGLLVENHRSLDRTQGWGYEALTALVEHLASTCTDNVAVIGRTYRLPWLFQPWLDADLAIAAELLLLVEKLDTHGQFWTHGSGGYGEGIHGWLDPEETDWLAELLDEFVGSTSWEQLSWADDNANELQSRLRQVQRVTHSAAKSAKGLLWGGDLEIFS